MKESKYLQKASDNMARAVAPTTGNFAFQQALIDFTVGMRRTYSAPIVGKVEYYPNGPGNDVAGDFCAKLEFRLPLTTLDSSKNGGDGYVWRLELSASAGNLDLLRDAILATMDHVDRHVKSVRLAVSRSSS